MIQADIEAVRQPIPNMDKVYAVLDAIEANPEHWDQEEWSHVDQCGTSMCFAGWAVHLEGIKLAVEVDGNNARTSMTADGRYIDTLAGRILGLTTDENYRLFVGSIYEKGSYAFQKVVSRAGILENVKVEVARIAARAKEQAAAFDRVAKELIESVPELENVGPLCPETRELVLKYLGGQDGGN